MKRAAFALCGLVLCSTVFGQIVRDGNNLGSKNGVAAGGGVTAQSCKDGSAVTVLVPNLKWKFEINASWFDPMVVSFDNLSIRDVIGLSGTDINCDGSTFILQAIRMSKKTPYIKCTAFVYGPGSGENTNFDTGLRFATNQNLDDAFCNHVFGLPNDSDCLGVRALLFSPPGTRYTLTAVYVRRDLATGRISAPFVVSYNVEVKVPSRDDIWANIVYFSHVAAGVTQKPKIDGECIEAFANALGIPDDLEALLQMETIIALCAIDFSVLRDAKNAKGNYDARFIHNYLIDSDEEPIGCLLIEMATAALWHP